MKLKAVLFDLDDTLMDLREASLIAFNSALRKHGLRQVSLEEMIRGWHSTWKETIERLAPDEDNLESLIESVGLDYMKTFSRIHLDHSRILPKAYETLRELHERGILTAIVSRRLRRDIEEEVEKFGLREFVDATVGRDDASRQKPDPEPVVLAAKKLGVSVRECAFVGDSPTDIRAGKLAGALTISVSTGSSKPEDVQRERPDVSIKAVADLIPTIEKLDLIRKRVG